MTLRRLITLPLAMLIIAGLAFAPLVTPASAKAMGMAKMSGMHTMSNMTSKSEEDAAPDMAAVHDMDSMHDTQAMDSMPGMEPMAADMPRCPNDKKNDACPDCPLMALCSLKTAQAHPSIADALPLRSSVRTIQFTYDDALVSGLDHPPPDHPPRSLI
jgi:hypothetical protein